MGMNKLLVPLAAAALLAIAPPTLGAEGGTPEFDGECVMGLATGKDIKTDCSVNTVIDGKTFCFGNEQAKQIFLKKPGEFLTKARVYYSSKTP
jgi:YHS domain-containing protein